MAKLRSCRVCAHLEVDRINAARAAGVPLESLAAKYGIPKSTLHDHWQHVPAEEKLTFLVGKSALEDLRARAVEENASALDYISIVRSGLMKVFKHHVEHDSAVGSAAVAGKLLDAIRETGLITGEIERVAGPQTNVQVNLGMTAAPSFRDLMEGLLGVARAHPEARMAIIGLVDRMTGAETPPLRPATLIEHEATHA